jgi:hypothetical protein
MSAKFTNPLSNVKIASPCSQDWNEMIGNERKRFCGECKLNVYNLSGMSQTQAEELLLNSEGRLCVRFYRRADGTVLTKDCPVGWQAIKRHASRMATAFASLIFGVIAGLGFAPSSALSGNGRTRFLPILTTPTPALLMGAGAAPTQTPKATPEEFIMGEMTVPTPQVTPKSEKEPRVFMGKLSMRRD